ncbi:unnamed protein product [Cylicocyclus nassatus]|uniref:Uncharacterized protein n=1 Tax=Cylicocyclus nassatus TaxID=53992 RepID=A0AA36H8G0_CYLNA|nr:unnamed protein product [Cylicocyclus nassatus]
MRSDPKQETEHALKNVDEDRKSVQRAVCYNFAIGVLVTLLILSVPGAEAGYIPSEDDRPINMRVQCASSGSQQTNIDPIGYVISAISPAFYLILFLVLNKMGFALPAAAPAPTRPAESAHESAQPLITPLTSHPASGVGWRRERWDSDPSAPEILYVDLRENPKKTGNAAGISPYDSRGHSAELRKVLAVDLRTKRIHSEVVNCSETGRISRKMEKKGFHRMLRWLQSRDFPIRSIATDRSPMYGTEINSYNVEIGEQIEWRLDPWHLATCGPTSSGGLKTKGIRGASKEDKIH